MKLQTKDKLLYTLKFNAVAFIAFLSLQGIIAMAHKPWVQMAMGSQAAAAELSTIRESRMVESKHIAVPNQLELIDTKQANYPTAEQQKAKANCEKSNGR